MSSKLAELVPTKPDAVVADEYRQRLIEALQPILKICDEAKRDGFTVLFGISPDAVGHHTITQLDLVKKY